MCVTNHNLDQSPLEGTELVATKRWWCVTKSKAHIIEELTDIEILGCMR